MNPLLPHPAVDPNANANANANMTRLANSNAQHHRPIADGNGKGTGKIEEEKAIRKTAEQGLETNSSNNSHRHSDLNPTASCSTDTVAVSTASFIEQTYETVLHDYQQEQQEQQQEDDAPNEEPVPSTSSTRPPPIAFVANFVQHLFRREGETDDEALVREDEEENEEEDEIDEGEEECTSPLNAVCNYETLLRKSDAEAEAILKAAAARGTKRRHDTL